MKKDKKMVRDAMVMMFEFSINMIVPILLCTFLGAWLGKKIDKLWIVVPFFFIGAMAGYTNIYKMAKRFLKDGDTKKETDVKKN